MNAHDCKQRGLCSCNYCRCTRCVVHEGKLAKSHAWSILGNQYAWKLCPVPVHKTFKLPGVNDVKEISSIALRNDCLSWRDAVLDHGEHKSLNRTGSDSQAAAADQAQRYGGSIAHSTTIA